MIAKAIEKILEMSKPNIEVINNSTYSDKALNRISEELRADTLHMSSLDSLIAYIQGFETDFKEELPYIIHIASPTQVDMYSALDADRKRERIVSVEASIPEFTFGHMISQEKFIIAVQSAFVDCEDDKALILKFAGTVKSGTVSSYKDDGVSQKATVKVGVASLAEAEVPNPCELTPYRTFTEVMQPTSKFIFRMGEERMADGITCGLFEADGGAWRLEAISNIHEYLREKLNDYCGHSILILR